MLSPNHSCHGKATASSISIVWLRMSLTTIQIPWILPVYRNNGFPLHCLHDTKHFVPFSTNLFRSSCRAPEIFFPTFDQILSFSRGFHKRLQYQGSRHSFKWKPSWYTRRDGHEAANHHFWWLKRPHLKTDDNPFKQYEFLARRFRSSRCVPYVNVVIRISSTQFTIGDKIENTWVLYEV